MPGVIHAISFGGCDVCSLVGSHKIVAALRETEARFADKVASGWKQRSPRGSVGSEYRVQYLDLVDGEVVVFPPEIGGDRTEAL